jgi:hypothetical protein
MKTRLLLLLIFIAQFTFAQQRTCGVQQAKERMMANPELRQHNLDLQEKFEVELQKVKNNHNKASNAQSPNVTIRIPVAVHYPSVPTTATSTLKTCLRNLAQAQINILNADYNATNADISNWSSASSFYPGTNVGNMDVQFILATQNHPSGTGLVNGDVAVTFGTDYLSNSDTDATWAGYCNIVVRNIPFLGYSPLGGSPAAGMTVVIDNNAFANGSGCTGYVPGAPYNLGRTLTHELGHFFNLDHTFDACDGANCATSGDSVCDTPSTNTEYYNCSPAGSVASSCSSLPQLTMNYMDYVEDSCMYMFTAGQAARMTAWYNTISSELNMNTLANESFLSNNFSIVPNPNKGSFTISFKEVLNDYSIQIFDATGRIVFENEYSNNNLHQQNINLNSNTKGIYFINIKSQGTLVTKKIIVE